MIAQKRKSLYSLALAIFIDSLGWGIVFPIFVPIILGNEIHIFPVNVDPTIRGLWYEVLIGVYCFFMFFMSPVLGSLSDYFGRKRILIFCLLGNCISLILTAIAILYSNLCLLLFSRIIAGATAGNLSIAQAGVVDISMVEDKAKNLSIISFWNLFGFASGPILGSASLHIKLLHNNGNYMLPFLFNALIAFSGSLVILLAYKDIVNYKKPVLNRLKFKNEFFEIIHVFLNNTSSKILYYIFIFYMIGWATFSSYLPLFLNMKFKLDGIFIGYFMSYIAAICAFSLLFLAAVINKLSSPKSIVSYSLLAMIICCFLFVINSSRELLWIIISLTIAYPLIYVGIVTLLSDSVDDSQQGKLMGIVGSISAFSWGIGPIIAGELILYGYTVGYIFSAIVFLIALILIKIPSIIYNEL